MITQLVDDILREYNVPKRDKYFIKEPAHIYSVCLRTSPLFQNFSDYELALYTAGLIYALVKTELRPIRRPIMKPSTALKEKLSMREGEILDTIKKIDKNSEINLWMTGSLKEDTLVIGIEKKDMRIYCSDDTDNDTYGRKHNLERFSFI